MVPARPAQHPPAPHPPRSVRYRLTHRHLTHMRLKLARECWNAYGKPLIADKYPEYQGRIAAGLVGHGSECYGFDDDLSRDHDFGPRFCLWLTDEDYAAIGERLQADYEALPQSFMGYGPRKSTARAQGAGRRDGVFRIGDFFESITGYRQAPSTNNPHEWLMLDEATLAAATNGEVFADPVGQVPLTPAGVQDHAGGRAAGADIQASGHDGAGRAIQCAAHARARRRCGRLAVDRRVRAGGGITGVPAQQSDHRGIPAVLQVAVRRASAAVVPHGDEARRCVPGSWRRCCG